MWRSMDLLLFYYCHCWADGFRFKTREREKEIERGVRERDSMLPAATVVILLLDWRLYRASSYVFLYIPYLLFSQACVCVCVGEGVCAGKGAASFGWLGKS